MQLRRGRSWPAVVWRKREKLAGRFDPIVTWYSRTPYFALEWSAVRDPRTLVVVPSYLVR